MHHRRCRSAGTALLCLFAAALPLANLPGSVMDEHHHFTQLFPDTAATHVVVADGDWSDSAIWQDGALPGDDAWVLIPAGREVRYDLAASPRYFIVRSAGALSFATDRSTTLRLDTLLVDGTGSLHIGSATAPLSAAHQVRILIDGQGPIDTAWDPLMLSRGIISHGAVRLYGEAKTPFVAVAVDRRAGETRLPVAAVPDDWRVGDQLVVAGTSWDESADFGNHDIVTLQGIDGQDLIVDALIFDHLLPADRGLAYHVANYSRNIQIETVGWDGLPVLERGHTMFMHNADVVVEGVAFIGQGRTDKRVLVSDPDGVGGGFENPRGRYAVHTHRAGVGSADSQRSRIAHCAVWDSPGWGFVVHESFGEVVHCASYGVIGSHYVTEDGNERARFIGNIAIQASGTDEDFAFLAGDTPRHQLHDMGVVGHGFWIETGASVEEVRDNVVAGTNGTGAIFWGTNDTNRPPQVAVAQLPVELQDLFPGQETVDASHVPLLLVSGNIFYNMPGGFDVRGNHRDDSGYQTPGGHLRQGLFRDAVVWGVREFGIHITYAAYVRLENPLVVGRPDDPILRNGAGPTAPRGAGIFMNKAARGVSIVDPWIEGFEIGLIVPQTGGQSLEPGEDRPFVPLHLAGGRFANNLRHFEPTNGRIGNQSTDEALIHEVRPFSPYSVLERVPVVDAVAGNEAPVAAFSSQAIGGSALHFDAAASFDPGYEIYKAGEVLDNDLPFYVWDFGDGTTGHGRDVPHVYARPGRYQVRLTVYDEQGVSDTTEELVSVGNTAFPDAIIDGSFDRVPAGNSGTTRWHDRHWTLPGGHRWNHDPAGFLYADRSGAAATVQSIHDRHVHRGLQTLRFRWRNTAGDQLRIQIWAVDERFALSNWNTDAPEQVLFDRPFASRLLYDQSWDQVTPEWQPVTDQVDCGPGGTFLAVRIWTSGADEGQVLAIDDLFLGTDDPPLTRQTTIQFFDTEGSRRTALEALLDGTSIYDATATSHQVAHDPARPVLLLPAAASLGDG